MKPLLPFSKKVSGELLGDNIIGMRPGETWDNAVKRFTLEQRMKKIIKIKKKNKGK